MTLDRDWDAELPDHLGGGGGDEIRVTEDELLLLDWVISSQPGLLLASDLDVLMGWRDFRLAVWEAIGRIEGGPSMGVMLSVPDMPVLLAVIPTSFNWGGSDNCGFTLKSKISQRMADNWVDPQIQRDVDDERERIEAEEAAELKRRQDEEVAAAVAIKEPPRPRPRPRSSRPSQ